MRYEGKSIEDAVAAASTALGRPEADVRYRVVRDEKSFWGGRLVEIEVEGAAVEAPAPEIELPEEPIAAQPRAAAVRPAPRARQAGAEEPRSGPPEGAMDEAAFAAVEATLTELLSSAGFFVEIRRRPGP